MKIGIISDLHIKERDKASDALNDEQISRSIRKILGSVDMLVLNGDTFDLLQGRAFPTRKNQEREFEKAKRAYPKTTQLLFNDDRISLVVGNHDRLLLKKVPVLFREHASIGKVYVTHGDIGFVDRRIPIVNVIVSWLGGWLERMFGRKSDDNLKQDLYRLGIRVLSNKSQIKWAKDFSESNGNYQYIVMGHTHNKESRGYGSFTYYNSGVFGILHRDVTKINI